MINAKRKKNKLYWRSPGDREIINIINTCPINSRISQKKFWEEFVARKKIANKIVFDLHVLTFQIARSNFYNFRFSRSNIKTVFKK